MYNEILKIGPVTIYGYGLMIGIGVLAALYWATRRGASRGLSSDNILTILLWILVTGFMGAKILYIITDWKVFIRDPLSTLGSEGFVVYGGIIVGLLVAWLVTRKLKLDFLATLDVFMPPVALAQGFGRIGCFLAGCCYGKVTDSVLGVVFPAGSGAPAGIAVLPTQLFSAAGDWLLAYLLFLYDRREHAKGNTGAMYLILYSVGRFIIEYFRDDPRGAVGFLSTSQFISVFTLLLGIALFIMNKKRSETPVAAADTSGEAETADAPETAE